MIRLTKTVLRRPVTTLLVVLSLLFFGGMAIFSSKLELTPEINMPMLVVATVYPGASPGDIDELVTRKLEENLGTLSGMDTMTSVSSENTSIVLMQYEYGTDMDNAYSDLRKRIDQARSSLPEDAQEPVIYEMDVNQVASMYVTVKNSGVNNIYNYTEKNVVPELEKLSSVASVDISGGQREYVRIELIPEKLARYHMDINTVAQLVGAASFTVPAGTAGVGNTEMNVSMGVKYKTPEELKRIPITVGGGNIIYLEDIANVYRAHRKASAVGRYNGEDMVLLGLNRNQKYTAVNVSRAAKAVFRQMEASDPNLQFIIVNDSADQITDSILTMLKTMLAAVAISTVVLFLFYGDVKASLIVATSIPISILTAFVMMWARGYSLNVITLGSVVLGVGMMVDNSIVILESCFRAKELDPEQNFSTYIKCAVSGAGQVEASVFGSTLTTCVVFLPLGFLAGLSGQFFQPLGMTIVFCMVASLLSAVSLVPLCFVYYKPVEKEAAVAYRFIRSLQSGYRDIMAGLMRHKRITILVTLLLFAGSIGLATQLSAKLMPDIDQGQITVSVSMKPNLNLETQDRTYRRIEEIITQEKDLDSYMISSGGGLLSGGSANLTAYLKEDREKTTDEIVEIWKNQLQMVDNCDIKVSAYSMTGMMNASKNYTQTLAGSDYDALKAASDRITAAMEHDPRLTGVSSSVGNASPIIKIYVDPVAAAAEGFVPAQVSGSLYTMLSGTEVDKMDLDGESVSVRVEYPDDEYDTIRKVENILLTSPSGSTVFLKDIAEVKFEDSPLSIQRINRQYQAEITASYTDLADRNTAAEVTRDYVDTNLSDGIRKKIGAETEMMNEEFGNLFRAILIAVFLVFVVMAAQFESPRFSFMVMTTIPFAMVGSFGLLWLFDIPLTMPALIGYLMLIGTVVNNGILYVDTVNQFREEGMELEPALVEAGTVRLRPILMTTLTTVLAMLPMALGIGNSAELMQGLAMVNVGGLLTSTIMALLVLPVYYYYMNGKKERTRVHIDEDEILE